LLFVCMGNTCRSPTAEALFKARMPASWRCAIEVTSAGTSAFEGQPASQPAVDVLADIGIDLSGHRAKRLTGELIESSDLVVVMAGEHGEEVRVIDPGAADKVIALGGLDPDREEKDIRDPIGGSRELYAGSRDEIEGLVLRLIDYVADKYGLAK
jgi:protein-tyrosine-phosphatase